MSNYTTGKPTRAHHPGHHVPFLPWNPAAGGGRGYDFSCTRTGQLPSTVVSF